jgi:hypothetical protein
VSVPRIQAAHAREGWSRMVHSRQFRKRGSIYFFPRARDRTERIADCATRGDRLRMNVTLNFVTDDKMNPTFSHVKKKQSHCRLCPLL